MDSFPDNSDLDVDHSGESKELPVINTQLVVVLGKNIHGADLTVMTVAEVFRHTYKYFLPKTWGRENHLLRTR